MSVVTVQLGQCGNQIGSSFFNTLIDDQNVKQSNSSEEREYIESSMRTFFHQDEGKLPEARAVLVDMEHKVITKAMTSATRSSKWNYPKAKQLSETRGSGNNWAHGYCQHGPRTKSAILEKVRKQVEKCDHFAGFLTLLSVAGGTGSGVGAYMNECLRDEYQHSFIFNQIVWPYNMGEVIVQNYNAVLTLSHLYQSADGILLFQNDDIHRICSRLLSLKSVSFDNLNTVISHQMAALLQPAFDSSSKGNCLIHNQLGDIMVQMCSHPQYRLLSSRMIPIVSEQSRLYNTYHWPGLLKHLRQMLIANAPMEEGIDWSITAPYSRGRTFNHSLCNLLVLRGLDVDSTDMHTFNDSQLYPKWLPQNSRCPKWFHTHPLLGQEKTAMMLSNSQSTTASVDRVTNKAWNMFSSRAYIHQYLKLGMEEEDFVDSFACLEQVIANYNKL